MVASSPGYRNVAQLCAAHSNDLAHAPGMLQGCVIEAAAASSKRSYNADFEVDFRKRVWHAVAASAWETCAIVGAHCLRMPRTPLCVCDTMRVCASVCACVCVTCVTVCACEVTKGVAGMSVVCHTGVGAWRWLGVAVGCGRSG